MSKPKSAEWLKREFWQSPKFNSEEYEAVFNKSQDSPDILKIKEQLFILATAYASFREIEEFYDEKRLIGERYCQTLLFTSLMTSFRLIANTLFLTVHGLYRNANHNVRYALELLILSEQFDNAYPSEDFFKKLTIFRNQEEQDELRMLGLLKALNHPCKGEITKEWRKLSKQVHPSYMQIIDTAIGFQTGSNKAVELDTREINSIYESLKNVSHFYLVSLLIRFPELKEPLHNNKDFLAALRDHDQRLALKLLSKRMGKQGKQKI